MKGIISEFKNFCLAWTSGYIEAVLSFFGKNVYETDDYF